MNKKNILIIPLLFIILITINNFIFANEVDKKGLLKEQRYSAGVGLDVGTNTVYFQRETQLLKPMSITTYIGLGYIGFNIGIGLHTPKLLSNKLKFSIYKNFGLNEEIVHHYTFSGSYIVKKFNASPTFISIGLQYVKYSFDRGYMCNYEDNNLSCPEIEYYYFTYPVFSLEYKL